MIKHKQQGISLLELMLSLAIIAILLVMATRYYETTRMSQQVDEAAEMVTAVYAAGNSWLESNTTFNQPDMLQAFVNNGSVPADFKSANINPWGGYVQVTGISTKNLTMTMSNVPSTGCLNLAAKVSQKMPGSTTSCTPDQTNPQVFTVIFNMGQ